MIAITGGAGFIGSALVWQFNRSGEHDILIVDQKAEHSPKWSNIEHLRFNGYLESNEFLESLLRGHFRGYVRAIIHMGACTDTTERDTKYLKRNNTQYSEKLAGWAVKNDVYFSYASSAALYGAGEKGYADDDSLTPQLKPLNPYGRSKLDFDKWVLKKKLQQKITGFRFFNVYGPNEYHKGHMRSMAHKGFEQIQQSGKLRLFKSYRPEYKDGEQKRDFVYVKDVAEAVLWFYRNPNWKGIYNLGSGKAQTWNELAGALFKACNKEPQVEYIEMPASIKDQYQYHTEADLSKFRKTGCPTGFRNLNYGISDYVQNHLANNKPYL